jgi:lipopolysaccharide transport system permease protein
MGGEGNKERALLRGSVLGEALHVRLGTTMGGRLAVPGGDAVVPVINRLARDFRHVVPFMVQLWMFATPCIYMRTESFLSPRWNAILPLNPAFGIIQNFRAATLGEPLDWYSLGISSTVALGFLLLGCLYFRRVERSFADII